MPNFRILFILGPEALLNKVGRGSGLYWRTISFRYMTRKVLEVRREIFSNIIIANN